MTTMIESMWKQPGRHGAGSAAENSHLTHKKAARREINWEQNGICTTSKPAPMTHLLQHGHTV